MLEFNTQDPFPLHSLGSYSYFEAKMHAIKVDQYLGLDVQEFVSTQDLQNSEQTWGHLGLQAYQTPYVEIRTFLSFLDLKGQETLADLGCAFGRMAHVIGRHYPTVKFVGYEVMPERVKKAQQALANFDYPNCEIREWNLVTKAPNAADVFFIYDYGNNEAIDKTLNDLRIMSRVKSLRVVARGRATRFFIHKNHPWLCEIHQPQHFDTFSIYQS